MQNQVADNRVASLLHNVRHLVLEAQKSIVFVVTELV